MSYVGCPYCKGVTLLPVKERNAMFGLDEKVVMRIESASQHIVILASTEMPLHQTTAYAFKARYCPVCGSELSEVQRAKKLTGVDENA